MAHRPLPTKTPRRTARPARRSATGLADVGERPRGEFAPASDATSGRGLDRDRPAVEPSRDRSTPSPKRAPTRRAADNSTLLFRALLLVAAAAALGFTVAAMISPPEGSSAGVSTSPEGPPPAVFVQPDR